MTLKQVHFFLLADIAANKSRHKYYITFQNFFIEADAMFLQSEQLVSGFCDGGWRRWAL
jgi:hypothetical protein